MSASTLTVTLGGTSQVTQYAAGINYTLAPKAVIYVEINSLGATNGEGDDLEISYTHTF